MRIPAMIVAAVLPLLPPRDSQLYSLCQRYADRYKGENDSNIGTNGEFWLMKKMLHDCRVVFDVGANVGDWAKLALTMNPSIDLHCFEPSQATFEQLQAAAFPSNVVCNNFGMGVTQDKRELHVLEHGAGINSLYRREGLEDGWSLAPQTRTETICLDTIDNYCQENEVDAIDFLKLDVEGHQLEVLRGASRILSGAMIKAIQFEYGGCNIDARVLLKDFFGFLGPFGYTLHKLYPEELRRIHRYDQRLENFQYQNWVVLPTE